MKSLKPETGTPALWAGIIAAAVLSVAGVTSLAIAAGETAEQTAEASGAKTEQSTADKSSDADHSSTSAGDANHVEINPPEDGSITPEQGLEAWGRVYQVTSHPRCANCHVGEDNVPMWSGPSYGKTQPHGMNINAGNSRMGAEAVLCMTCHVTSKDTNTEPNHAPRYGIPWSLAPVKFQWFGKSSKEICEQLKDPERNGGRAGYMEIAEHLQHDASRNGPVFWGWHPGGNREPAPFTIQDHVNDILAWGVAGMPCPTE